jgi:tetratricopeptide (TPR) repeat protein
MGLPDARRRARHDGRQKHAFDEQEIEAGRPGRRRDAREATAEAFAMLDVMNALVDPATSSFWMAPATAKGPAKRGSRKEKRRQGRDASPGNDAVPTPKRKNPFAAVEAWLAGAGLALLTLVACWPALSAVFLLDDLAITRYSAMFVPDGLRLIWLVPGSNRLESHYWPLTYTSFWLEKHAWGLAPFGYHLDNVLLHVAVTLLTWWLLRRLKLRAAWLGAALFGVHPIHMESIAWAIERKDVLCGLFSLLAMHAWWDWVERRRRGRLALAFVFLAMSLLSKSASAFLPIAMATLAWWRVGRLRRGDVLAAAGLAALTVGITIFDLHVLRTSPTTYRWEPGFTLLDRVALAGRSAWAYVGRCLWPAGLTTLYGGKMIPAARPEAWWGLGALAIVGAGLLAARRCLGGGPLAAFVIFLAGMAPALGLVTFYFMRYSLTADRFVYLPSIAFLAAVAEAVRWGVEWMVERHWLVGRRAPMAVASVALLLPLACLCWRQATFYHDDMTLPERCARLYPENWSGHHLYGCALRSHGKLDRSLAELRLAIAMAPGEPDAHRTLAELLAVMHRDDEALAEFKRVLEIRPEDAEARGNRAILYMQRKQIQEAEADFQKVLAYRADDFTSLKMLGEIWLIERHNPEKAKEYFLRVLDAYPDSAEVHFKLALTCDMIGDVPNAIRHYVLAMRLGVSPDMRQHASERLETLSKKARNQLAQ